MSMFSLCARLLVDESQSRRQCWTRCIIFYIAAFSLAEMFSSPAWLLAKEDDARDKRRFWESSGMLWAYRMGAVLTIAVVIPLLRYVSWARDSMQQVTSSWRVWLPIVFVAKSEGTVLCARVYNCVPSAASVGFAGVTKI